jgi:PAS domain S-box-containing protein
MNAQHDGGAVELSGPSAPRISLASRALLAVSASGLLGAAALSVMGLSHLYDQRIPAWLRQVLPLLALAMASALVLVVLGRFSVRLRQALQAEAVARRSAEESAALLDTLFNAAPVGLSFLDPELRFVRVNPALAEMNGPPVEAHIGHSLREMIPALAPDVVAAQRAALQGRPLLAAEVSGETAARPGVRRDWLVSHYPVRLGERILGTGAVVVDVSEGKRAERSLKFLLEASRALSASLDFQETLRQVAALPVPALADHAAVYVEEPQGAVRRRATAHAVEENGADTLFDQLAGARALAIEEVLQTRTQRLGSTAAAGPGATRSLMTLPLVRREQAFGVLCLVNRPGRVYEPRDLEVADVLAHRASVALENARLYAAQRQAVRLRDDFISVASHELKTPLTALRLQVDGYLRLLGRGVAVQPAQLGKLASDLDYSVGRLDRLVEDLLDFSRISSGRLDLRIELVDLAEVVREIAERFAPQLAEARCFLGLQPGGPLVGDWDRLRLEQITANLLSNAVKYGAGAPIEVEVAGDDERATLRVRDHGIGIAAEDQGRIFERFERAVSRRSHGGFGLGLWIARRVAHAMGGTIEVQSQAGAGATFTVTLPRRRRALLEERGSRPEMS